MKMVDAEKLTEKSVLVQDFIDPELGYFIVPIGVVKTLPIIDAVEVVRCKDCIWYGKKHELDACNRIYGFSIAPMMPDDYCSYGKRKE